MVCPVRRVAAIVTHADPARQGAFGGSHRRLRSAWGISCPARRRRPRRGRACRLKQISQIAARAGRAARLYNPLPIGRITLSHIPPLLVTLGLDSATFDRLDALRTRYFPPERNLIPAHLSLFHHLPGEEESAVGEALAAVAASRGPIPVRFSRVRKLGRGMALTAEAPGLAAVHATLGKAFARWFTPQDRQPFRPHVTLMNKADPHQAALAFAELSDAWELLDGVGESLLLWAYLGGPWRFLGRYPFTADDGKMGAAAIDPSQERP